MLDKIDISNLSFDEIERALRLLEIVADPSNWDVDWKYENGHWGDLETRWLGKLDVQEEAKLLLEELVTDEDEWD